VARARHNRIVEKPPSKVWWTILGTILGTIMLVTIYFVGSAMDRIGQMQSTGKAYAKEALPAIVQTWNPDALASRAAPELRQIYDDEAMAMLMKRMSDRLGPLKKAGELEAGNIQMPGAVKGQAPFVTMRVVATSSFEKGEATVAIDMIRREGKWAISSFNVGEPGKIAPAR